MSSSEPWIDISLPLGPDTPVFPGDPAVVVAPLTAGEFQLSALSLGSHSGTHLDAPAHLLSAGKPLGHYPPERWLGEAWVLVFEEGEAITASTLAARWPKGAIERVLLATPNSARWADADVARRYQALSVDGARWLVARGVGLVGIDALSIDAPEDTGFPVHRVLLGADVLILEGLDLSGVAAGRYELVCAPLKLSAPDGAPVRALLRRL